MARMSWTSAQLGIGCGGFERVNSSWPRRVRSIPIRTHSAQQSSRAACWNRNQVFQSCGPADSADAYDTVVFPWGRNTDPQREPGFSELRIKDEGLGSPIPMTDGTFELFCRVSNFV